jgi:hypothetical protein
MDTDFHRYDGLLAKRPSSWNSKPVAKTPENLAALRRFLFQWNTRLDHVHEDVQAQPYHVDKVPVPGDAFEGEVMRGREVAL